MKPIDTDIVTDYIILGISKRPLLEARADI